MAASRLHHVIFLQSDCDPGGCSGSPSGRGTEKREHKNQKNTSNDSKSITSLLYSLQTSTSRECFKQTTLSTITCLTMSKPTVRFDGEVLTTGLIESSHDQQKSSHDQQTTLWYSQSDFERFHKETRDNFTNPCRQRLVKSILSQQWEHQKLGMSDPKGLEKLSRACSKGARERARALAIANACDVNGAVPDSQAKRSPTRNSCKLSVSPVPQRVLPKAVWLSALSA